MQRPRIDKAIHAQIDRMTRLLRDVDRSGGHDVWSHLFSRGHAHATLRAAVRRKLVRHQSPYYFLTEDGRAHLTWADELSALSTLRSLMS